jgi:hypothetical protein
MLHTAEVGWFIRGGLPREVVEWFWHGVSRRDPDTREDRYLVLPGCDAAGVKVRRGTSLDVKARVGDGVAVSYGTGIEGVRERWVKWSSDSPLVTAGLATAAASGREWLGVRKERHLRFFSLDSVLPVELETYAATGLGCHVELTRVLAGDTNPFEAWTLGLEAYGDRQRLEEAVDASVTYVLLGRPAPVPFTLAASMGYAAWLNRLPSLRSGVAPA